MNQQSLLSGGLIPRAQKADGRTNLPLTFRTILADPPWDVLQRGGRGAHRHYALMTVEEIAALPVGQFANADAHLWLWVTNATLFAGHMVMNTWGFTYRSCLTWVKPGLGLGSSYLRNNTEHLLFGTKGRAPILYRSQPTWLFAAKQDHSHKPEEQVRDYRALLTRAVLGAIRQTDAAGLASVGQGSSQRHCAVKGNEDCASSLSCGC